MIIHFIYHVYVTYEFLTAISKLPEMSPCFMNSKMTLVSGKMNILSMENKRY